MDPRIKKGEEGVDFFTIQNMVEGAQRPIGEHAEFVVNMSSPKTRRSPPSRPK